MHAIARAYDRYLLPPLVHAACNVGPIHRQRQKVVPHATGRVLEIGVGSGLNLPHYTPGAVDHLWALDPSAGMTRRAERAAAGLPFPVEVLGLSAETIPLPDDAVDTVVMTYTLCTIPTPAAALAEIRRVLRPGGRLCVSEHALDPTPARARWQHRLNPVWRPLAGGCHLNRDIAALLAEGGFDTTGLQRADLPGLAVLRHHVWGVLAAR